MRKLIEIDSQEDIKCDNPDCDFVIESINPGTWGDLDKYLNMPCPKCGENLLTQEDYDDTLKLMKTVNFLNKWFSWLTIFSFGKKSQEEVTVNVHKGIHITKEKYDKDRND